MNTLSARILSRYPKGKSLKIMYHEDFESTAKIERSFWSSNYRLNGLINNQKRILRRMQ